MKNYRTTLMGGLIAIIIAVQPLMETGQINWKQIGFAALIACMGYISKDAKVTGV